MEGHNEFRSLKNQDYFNMNNKIISICKKKSYERTDFDK